MKELAIHYLRPKGRGRPRLRVSYRPQEGAQAQEADAPFSFLLSDEQLDLIQWYLEEYLLYPWGEFRTRAEDAESSMAQIGGQLFDAVFRTRRAAALYAHVADDLGNTRVVVHAESPEAIAIPWELIRNPVQNDLGYLATQAYAFVRSHSGLIFNPPPAPEGETFNILLVICRPRRDDGKADVPFQSVARPLLELFRPYRDRIRVDVVRPPTVEQLTRVLADRPNFYHVLHFDGHGAFPEGSNPAQFYGDAGAQGQLLFETDDEGPRLVSGGELGQLLVGKGVPIVLLNACQSGMSRPQALYPSVANQLLQAGAAGVVAMAYSVLVDAVVRFMARLYEALMQGEELARAVTLGRDALRAHPDRFSPIGPTPLRDWMVPVLFEAAPVRATRAPLQGVHLPVFTEDHQAKAGAEIECPDPPVFGFVGQDDVIQDLERAFRHADVVLLRGMAGVGKTEAAMGFARWRAETGALAGPIFFFRFDRHVPLAQVVDRVGQAFAPVIKTQMGLEWAVLDAGRRRQVASALLRSLPCLLIWDNFEPVAGFPKGTESVWTKEEQGELRAFLGELRGGQTKVLITSRRGEPWLGPIYRPLDLSGLRLRESQELAVRVLRRAGLNPPRLRRLPDYTELLSYLGGNPLAIQVVLPELARLSPEALLAALRAGEAHLEADDPALGRERSLAASLAYRLDALDPAARQRLGLVALFEGVVEAQLLAIICSQEGAAPELAGMGEEAAWTAVLDSAAEIGLLRSVGGGRYAVHPAVPWFLHDLLREAFPQHQAWLERGFATAYAALGHQAAKEFETQAQLVVALLRADEGNLLQALRRARQHGLWGAAAGILYGLHRLLVIQGRWLEWERLVGDIWAEAADADGQPRPGREVLWEVMLGLRQEIAGYRRDFDSQARIVRQLRAHYERQGDERNLAVALHQLGMIAEERRNWKEAEDFYRQSLVIEERIGDEQGQASTLHQLGRVAEERRNWKEAEDFYRQSLAIAERIGNEQGQASTLHQLGRVAEERADLAGAAQRYRAAEAIFARFGDEHNLGIVRRSLHRAEGDGAERSGSSSDLTSLAGEAAALARAGNWGDADRLLTDGIQRCKEESDTAGGPALFLARARLRAQMRAYDQARWDYKKALALWEGLGNPDMLAQVELELADLEARSGLTNDAAARLERAAERLGPEGSPELLAATEELLQRLRATARPPA